MPLQIIQRQLSIFVMLTDLQGLLAQISKEGWQVQYVLISKSDYIYMENGLYMDPEPLPNGRQWVRPMAIFDPFDPAQRWRPVTFATLPDLPRCPMYTEAHLAFASAGYARLPSQERVAFFLCSPKETLQ